ncbi:MAG: mandelate racemase/muconate lactonizing enzyme family protein [Alicyclobacillus sp.]|nr:mandelate racemase/muconate lactonizing enzyme family protein [Alicyclobacillus sp.]
MRITRVEPIVLRVPLDRPVETSFGRMTERTTVLVRVETDEGLSGIGEVWNNFPAWGVYEKLATLRYGVAPLLAGEDPRRVRHLHDKLLRALTVLGLQWGALGPVYHSISGIDIALWDLWGKICGRSVSELLGGPVQKEVPVYASGLGPGPFADLLEMYQALGVTAFKLKVGREEAQDVRNMAEMRRMVGENARVMVDANQAWDVRTAIRMVNGLREAGLTWMEEPVRCDDLDGLREVRQQTGVPVAAGENLYGRRQAREALERRVLDVIQPDLSKNGGLTECVRVMEMAAAFDVPYAPHFLGGAVCLAASVHVLASVPGGWMLEYDANPNPIRERLLTQPLRIRDGKLAVPDGPGLGIALDPEFLQFYQLNL